MIDVEQLKEKADHIAWLRLEYEKCLTIAADLTIQSEMAKQIACEAQSRLYRAMDEISKFLAGPRTDV